MSMTQRMRFSRRLLGTTFLFGVVAIASGAQAQALQTGAPTSPPTATTLADVVVTARKRTEHVQDVPSAISVISSTQLTQGSPRDLKDLLKDVPGVSFSGAEFGQSNYSIDGISTNSTNPTTGIYLDDISLVTLGSNFTGAIDLVPFDLNRVEVLKGPQGTLYGGSAMGGAIKYVSQTPSLNNQTEDVSATGSTTAHGAPSYDFNGVINIPIVEDKFAIRAGVLYRNDGGYINNIAGGVYENYVQSSTNPPAAFAPTAQPSYSTRTAKDQNSDQVLGVRLSALWKPDDSLEITPSIYYQRYHEDNPSIYWTNLPQFESAFRATQPTTDELAVAGLTIVKHLNGIDLTSLTGYVDRTVLQDRDYSFFNGTLVPPIYPLGGPNTSNTFTRTVSQEIRASSSVADSPLHWTAGLYYSDQSDDFKQKVVVTGGGAVLGTGTDTMYYGQIVTTTDQYALFGNLTYTILPKLDLGVGLRVFDIELSDYRAAGGLFNGGTSQNSGKSSEKGVDPKFEVDYRATRDNLLYASAAKGFRPGGENATISASLCGADLKTLGLSSVPDSYQSDSLWTYEVGSKNQFLDRRLTLNATAYYTDWSQIQQTVNLPTCGFAYTGNVGAATVRGGELGGQYRFAPGLVAGGGVNYADAQITQTLPGVSARVGQPVLGTPKWMANAFLSYSFSIWNGTLTSRADYQYHGSQLNDFSSTYIASTLGGAPVSEPNINQYLKSYSVVSLSLTLSKGRYDYNVFVNNLLDASPIVAFSDLNEFTQAETIRPRTIGFNVKAHF
jgi:iron complex outermembrane receptor protein